MPTSDNPVNVLSLCIIFLKGIRSALVFVLNVLKLSVCFLCNIPNSKSCLVGQPFLILSYVLVIYIY